MRNNRFRYISKIGFELETSVFTCWYNKFSVQVKDIAGSLAYDGSIRANSGYTAVEFRSFAYDEQNFYAYLVKDLKKLFEYVDAKNVINAGFHIHLSFKDINYYNILFSKNFVKYFVREYKKYFKQDIEVERLRNSYCKIQYKEIDFLPVKDRDRYKAVNFVAYSEHSTIEFRIFPSNNIRILRYILFTINVVNKYIDKIVRRRELLYSLNFDTKEIEKLFFDKERKEGIEECVKLY